MLEKLEKEALLPEQLVDSQLVKAAILNLIHGV
jgi:hypothetical protein